MLSTRRRLILPLVVIALLPAARPAAGQLRDAQVDITPRFAEMLAAGKDQPTVIQLLAEGLTFRARTRESTSVVLFFAHISGEWVVAKGQTKPFQLNVKAAASVEGMLGSSVFTAEQLLRLSPLSWAHETWVTSYARATESANAAQTVTDPLSALQGALLNQRNGGDVLIIALMPADPAARRQSHTSPLFQVMQPKPQ
jgi:hypothetical protein